MTRPRMTCPRCGRDVAATIRLAAQGQRLRVPAPHNCQPPELKPPSAIANLDDVEIGDPRPKEDIPTKGRL